MDIQHEFLKRLCDQNKQPRGYVDLKVLQSEWPQCPDRNSILKSTCASYFDTKREDSSIYFHISPKGIEWLNDYDAKVQEKRISKISLAVSVIALATAIVGIFISIRA